MCPSQQYSKTVRFRLRARSDSGPEQQPLSKTRATPKQTQSPRTARVQPWCNARTTPQQLRAAPSSRPRAPRAAAPEQQLHSSSPEKQEECQMNVFACGAHGRRSLMNASAFGAHCRKNLMNVLTCRLCTDPHVLRTIRRHPRVLCTIRRPPRVLCTIRRPPHA